MGKLRSLVDQGLVEPLDFEDATSVEEVATNNVERRLGKAKKEDDSSKALRPEETRRVTDRHSLL